MNMLMPKDSILSEVEHDRLIQDLEQVCTIANVPQLFVHHSMKQWCKKEEVDWVKNFNKYRQEKAGLVLVGVTNISTLKNPQQRMMAIAGALLRNFIDVRVYSLNQVVAKDGPPPEPSVMVILNLYMSMYGKTMASWEVQGSYDLLLSRMVASKPTIMFVHDMELLRKEYGDLYADHLEQNYILITK